MAGVVARDVFDYVRLVPVVALEEPHSSHVPRNVVVIGARSD